MLEDDPFAAAPKKPRTLDLMSIEELEERIATLTEEIETCRRAIAAKQAQRSVADQLFTTRPS